MYIYICDIGCDIWLDTVTSMTRLHGHSVLVMSRTHSHGFPPVLCFICILIFAIKIPLYIFLYFSGFGGLNP